MQEPATDRLARVEERVRMLEIEMGGARQRLHHLGGTVNPLPLILQDVERHEQQLQDLRALMRAARWLVLVLAPLLTIATALTPLLVRWTIRDAISHYRGVPLP